jgi:type 2 lantibiotic biosynthesis protein LanM
VPFGLAAERLAGSVVGDDTAWPVYRHERRALRRYDVPRFTVAGDETVVRHDGEPVAELPDAAPADRVRRRIAELSTTDLTEQLDYLRLAFDSLSLSHRGAPAPAPIPAGRDETWATRRVPRLLFDRISEAAVGTDDNRTWLVRDYRETKDGAGAHVAAVDDTLYGGRLGIALFGAGLAATTDADRYRAFVRETVAPVETALAGESPYPQLDLGATSGVGALVYGFTTLARLLEQEQYLDVARRAAALVTDERIAADDTYDVLRGSAGAVLGLLALHAETGDRTALDRARAAGDHLLSAGETVTPAGGGTATVWSTIQSQPLCGVSHGVGGIAYALERLGRRTGEDRYVATAREAFSFEEWAYDEGVNNWPDRRDSSETEFVRGWCTGRAGIGLTRLELLRETTGDVAGAVGTARDDEQTLGGELEPLARDVQRTLAGVESQTLAHRDHPCCGNTGRIEFLLAAGRAGLGDHEKEARRLADATARRGERAGRFTTPWTTDEWTNPTFFGGDAGIGYTLLRVANPELPCVLAFE